MNNDALLLCDHAKICEECGAGRHLTQPSCGVCGTKYKLTSAEVQTGSHAPSRGSRRQSVPYRDVPSILSVPLASEHNHQDDQCPSEQMMSFRTDDLSQHENSHGNGAKPTKPDLPTKSDLPPKPVLPSHPSLTSQPENVSSRSSSSRSFSHNTKSLCLKVDAFIKYEKLKTSDLHADALADKDAVKAGKENSAKLKTTKENCQQLSPLQISSQQPSRQPFPLHSSQQSEQNFEDGKPAGKKCAASVRVRATPNDLHIISGAQDNHEPEVVLVYNQSPRLGLTPPTSTALLSPARSTHLQTDCKPPSQTIMPIFNSTQITLPSPATQNRIGIGRDRSASERVWLGERHKEYEDFDADYGYGTALGAEQYAQPCVVPDDYYAMSYLCTQGPSRNQMGRLVGQHPWTAPQHEDDNYPPQLPAPLHFFQNGLHPSSPYTPPFAPPQYQVPPFQEPSYDQDEFHQPSYDQDELPPLLTNPTDWYPQNPDQYCQYYQYNPRAQVAPQEIVPRNDWSSNRNHQSHLITIPQQARPQSPEQKTKPTENAMVRFDQLSSDPLALCMEFLTTPERARACGISTHFKTAGNVAHKRSSKVVFAQFTAKEAVYLWNYTLRNLKHIDTGAMDPGCYGMFNAVATKFINLRVLRMNIEKFTMDDEFNYSTIQRFEQLEELSISLRCRFGTYLNLMKITSKCKKIKTLRIYQDSDARMGGRRYSWLDKQTFQAILTNMPCLEVLALDCDFRHYCEWLDDHQTPLKNIKKLELYHADWSDFSVIVSMFPNLEELYLLRLVELSVHQLCCIKEIHLRTLALHFCPDERYGIASAPAWVVEQVALGAIRDLEHCVFSMTVAGQQYIASRVEEFTPLDKNTRFTFSANLPDFRIP